VLLSAIGVLQSSQPPLARCVAPSASAIVTALDFDGVLCDSEPELTRSAWRAAKELWPDMMESVGEYASEPWQAGARRAWAGGEWDQLTGLGEDGLPNWLAAKMRLLRPVLETGYESLLMMRLCADEALVAQRTSSGQRPLTTGEITANWNDLRDMLLARYGLKREEAIEAYSAVRDSWLTEDLDSWLQANKFYPGTVAAVSEAMAGGAQIYIVTTKQRRFAQALLHDAGIILDDAAIYGLGSGPKADTLCELQAKHEGARLSFVEDRVETLRLVANDPRLFGCELYFAEWGYSNAEQQAKIAAMPRVRSLATGSDLGVLYQP